MNKKTYDNAIKELTSQGKFYINLGLERITKVLNLLDNPHKQLKIIHVAGTNGKGSTCAIIASILKESGYKTGLFTSPHLIEYTERIKINDNEISKEDFADYLFKILDISKEHDIHLTEFEIITAIGFLYFKDNRTDYVVLETGLGGRLDSTNVCTPIASVITDIGIDHIDRLGDTVEKIAFEKAGIIKDEIPVITLKDNQGIEVIETYSKKIYYAKPENIELKDYSVLINTNEYEFNLRGLWQKRNLALALKTLEVLELLNENSLKKGLKNVKWNGRFQYIKEKNLIIDGAHNIMAAKSLRKSLDKYYPNKKRLWLYSSLNTKNYEGIMNELFNKDDNIIVTFYNIKNAINPTILKQTYLKNHPDANVSIVNNSEELALVLTGAKYKDYLKVACGSLYNLKLYL